MPTTPFLPPPPTSQGSALSPTDYQWMLIVQGLAPLYEVDTSRGSYTEKLPPAGVGTSGQTGQCKEIVYVKTSADANTDTITGAITGPVALKTQYQVARFKSDGTNWFAVGTTGSGSGPALQVNGVPNADQALLNLFAGSNVTLTDAGAGKVVIAATGGTAFSGSGAYFFGPGITDPAAIFSLLGGNAPSGSAAGVLAANVVVVYLFALLAEWTISKVTTESNDSFGGVTATFGIYDVAGNKVLDAGAFSCLAASGVQVNAIAPVTLPPGLYWHAQATTSTNDPHFPGLIVAAGGHTPAIMAFLLKNATRAATAANPLVVGVLPATLGALTPFTPSNANGDGICCPLYE